VDANASKEQLPADRKRRRKNAQQGKQGTEQAQSEKSLLESEQLFHAVWEASSDAMAISTADGIVQAANPAYYRLYGLSPEEVIGKDFSVIFPSEQREWAMKLYNYVFSSPTSSSKFEDPVIRGDGTERIVEASYSFLMQDGKRVAMLSIIRDITERKKAEENLRESELKLHLALEAAHMITWDWDIVRNCVQWSSNVEAPLKEFLQQRGATYEALLELVHPEDRTMVNEEVQRALRNEDEMDFKVKYRILVPDGTILWTMNHGQVLYDEDGGKPVRMIGVSMRIKS
jgi:PAS domain S-box-containing protein